MVEGGKERRGKRYGELKVERVGGGSLFILGGMQSPEEKGWHRRVGGRGAEAGRRRQTGRRQQIYEAVGM